MSLDSDLAELGVKPNVIEMLGNIGDEEYREWLATIVRKQPDITKTELLRFHEWHLKHVVSDDLMVNEAGRLVRFSGEPPHLVGENLELHRFPNLKTLPDNLSVCGYLILSWTGVEKLPKNMTVLGDLFLANTRLRELPEGLKVGGMLYIAKTEIRRLPPDIVVLRGVDQSNTEYFQG